MYALDYTKLNLDTELNVTQITNCCRPPRNFYFRIYSKKSGSKNIDNYTVRIFEENKKVECLQGKKVKALFKRFGIGAGHYLKMEIFKISPYMFQLLNEGLLEEEKLDSIPKGIYIKEVSPKNRILKFNLQEDQENGKQK